MPKQFPTLLAILLMFSTLAANAGMNEAVLAIKNGDFPSAVRELSAPAEQGNAAAQYLLGLAYYNGQGVQQDYSKAFEWLLKAAEQGNANAQNTIGTMYFKGQAVPQDNSKAFGWYRKSAEQGNPTAQHILGLAYYTGEGLPQDFMQALFWYRKAAEQGYALAQNGLGSMYLKGEGMPKDYEKGFEWFRKSANQGNAVAQNILGIAYYTGEGIRQDYEQAATLFRKAADQGNPQAQVSIGNMYLRGQSVPQDRDMAIEWFRKAANQGNFEAKNILITLSSLSAAQPKKINEKDVKTLLPAIRNSPDTYCAFRRQCTQIEFLEATKTIGRQWELTPEWIRAKCAKFSTLPTIERCLLSETKDWLASHPNEQAPWIVPDNFTGKQTAKTNSNKSKPAELFDSIDEAVGDCETKEIATGRHFVINRLTGNLDLRTSALRVISVCLRESNAWVDQCIKESGNSEGCTKQSLLIPQQLIKEAWLYRNNLKEWARRASQ